MSQERFDHYARMRATAPVQFNPQLQLWEVYRYADIQTVLGDPQTFSSDASVLQTMATMDPPRHTQLRRLVARAFSAKLIADLEPRIVDIVDGLMARAAQTGTFDVVNDLAFPLPVTVIAELLGLPVEDQLKFKAWSIPAIKAAEAELHGLPVPPEHLAAVAELEAYLRQMADARKTEPRADLVSGLVHAEIEGQRLTDEEIVSTCRLLLIAGFETSANLIGNTLHLLLLHPEVLARVRNEPEQIEPVIEEALRLQTPFQFLARKATRVVELAGQQIQPGQLVLLMLGSGNRDESAFERADEFDPWRPPVRHLSFGHGIHYCLGAGLGRMEARIAITRLLAQFKGLRLHETQPTVALQSMVLFGLQHLPVQWDEALAKAA